jgi:hypothetical protein
VIAGLGLFDLLEYLVVEWVKKKRDAAQMCCCGGSCGFKEAGNGGANAVDSGRLMKVNCAATLSVREHSWVTVAKI